MRVLRICFLFSLFLFACKAKKRTPTFLTIRFSESPQPIAPNYSEAKNWAALPNRKDASDAVPKGYKDGQQNALADVFYIHPTTYTKEPIDSYQWNADVNNATHNKKVDDKPIKFQASIFNGSCKVYAPRYRQAHYYCFVSQNQDDKQMALNLAYDDIKASFEYYLNNYNSGRPIVIAAHSQGTVHAQRLLRDFFENKALQNQLVAAYLVGMPVPTDSLPTLLPCKDSTQTGCYVSWRTFLKGYTPNWHAGDPAKLVCQNPLSWQLDTNYVSKTENIGAVLRNFNKVNSKVCDAQVHEGLLWINKPKFPGSRFYNNPNYHIGDYNLFYLNVRENVGVRVKNFIEK